MAAGRAVLSPLRAYRPLVVRQLLGIALRVCDSLKITAY